MLWSVQHLLFPGEKEVQAYSCQVFAEQHAALDLINLEISANSLTEQHRKFPVVAPFFKSIAWVHW